MPISATDRDLMIRTMIGEADDQPPIGQAAVAHVILNRMDDGRWGDTPSQVVLSRGQFEPWQTRAKELSAIKTESPRYQKMAAVADAVLRGDVPDPTNGATHFLQEDLVRKRRGGSLPDWASGEGLKIGAHTFFRPPEMNGGQDAISRAVGVLDNLPASARAFAAADAQAGSPRARRGNARTAQNDDLISEWATAPNVAPAKPSVAAPADEDLISEWMPKIAAAPAKPVVENVDPSKMEIIPPSGRETLPQTVNRLARENPDSAAIRLGAGVLRGVGDVGDTLAQGITATGDAGAGLLSRLGIISPESAKAVADWRAGVNADITRENAAFDQAGGTAGELGRVGGQVLGTGPFLSAAGGALGAATRGAPVVAPIVRTVSKIPMAPSAIAGAATGAGASLLTSASSDVPLEDQLTTAAKAGAVLGPIGRGVGRLTGKLAAAGVDRETADLAASARDKFGINVRASQISANPMVRFMDSVLQRLPFTGLGPHSAEQQLALQRALAKEMGAASDKITPDVVRSAQRTAYNAYDAAKANMGALNVDRSFYSDLVNVHNNAHYNLEAPQAKLIDGHLKNVMDKIGGGSTLDPDLYQSLTRKNGPLDKAINSRDSKISTYAGDIKEALENLVGRNNPALKTLKDRADYRYFVAKAVEPLADEATTGNISPAKLLKALDYSHTDAGELGRIARRFLVEPPSSGTAERLFVMQHLPQLIAGATGLGGLTAATYFDPESWQRNAVLGAGAIGLGGLSASALKSQGLSKLMIRAGQRPPPAGGRLPINVNIVPTGGALINRRASGQPLQQNP
jgi:Cell Wall Hydrolase